MDNVVTFPKTFMPPHVDIDVTIYFDEEGLIIGEQYDAFGKGKPPIGTFGAVKVKGVLCKGNGL